MKWFKENPDSSITVECPVLEVYFPEFYISKGFLIQGSGEYTVFGVGNFRPFATKGMINKREDLPMYTLGIPMMFKTAPSEYEMMDISTPVGYPARRTCVLRYFQGDKLFISTDLISESDNNEIAWNLAEDGKSDFVNMFDISVIIAELSPKMNASKMKVSIEAANTVICERMRNPKDLSQSIRHMKSFPEYCVTVNAREDASMKNSMVIIGFEDINTGLLVANNRYRSGKIDEITQSEKIMRGIRPNKV